MEISLVFSNIVINCSRGKHFLLCFILLWINFYNLRYITKVTPLPEPKRSHQNRQKQFIKKSLHCFIEPPVVTSHTKFCLSTVNKFKVISLSRHQLFVHILLSHGSRCYLPIQSYHFISLNKCLVICNNINCKASLNYFSTTLKLNNMSSIHLRKHTLIIFAIPLVLLQGSIFIIKYDST